MPIGSIYAPALANTPVGYQPFSAKPTDAVMQAAAAGMSSTQVVGMLQGMAMTPVYLTQRDLTKAEVNAAVNLTIVPAPGAGRLLIPLHLWAERNTTAVFSQASNITLQRAVGVALIGSITGIVSSTETGYKYMNVGANMAAESPANGVDFRNVALLLAIANASTGGSAGIRVSLLYTIVTSL